jgi:hypothetical protein
VDPHKTSKDRRLNEILDVRQLWSKAAWGRMSSCDSCVAGGLIDSCGSQAFNTAGHFFNV